MDYRKEYEKETGLHCEYQKAYPSLSVGGYFNEYTEWLETRLKESEKKLERAEENVKYFTLKGLEYASMWGELCIKYMKLKESLTSEPPLKEMTK